MASGTYNLNLLPHRFSIGRQGENRYRKVSFDVYKFVEPVLRDSADGVIFLVGVFVDRMAPSIMRLWRRSTETISIT